VKVSRLAVLSFIYMVFAGCGGSPLSLADWFGATNKPHAVPITEDILCDASSGSSCNARTLREAVDVALREAAGRPGSVVRVWMQGRSIETTRIVAEARSGAARGTGRRALAEYESRWISNESEAIAAATRSELRKPVHRSPIAESIGVIGLAPAVPRSTRELIVITDGMEMSDFGDFECGPLPKSERFTRLLARNRILPAHSLRGIAVRFCHFDLGAIDRGRCPLSLLRASEIRSLWQAALTAAGARSVEIREGGPDPSTETTSQGKDQSHASTL
jgi:hypothetical protein